MCVASEFVEEEDDEVAAVNFVSAAARHFGLSRQLTLRQHPRLTLTATAEAAQEEAVAPPIAVAEALAMPAAREAGAAAAVAEQL